MLTATIAARSLNNKDGGEEIDLLHDCTGKEHWSLFSICKHRCLREVGGGRECEEAKLGDRSASGQGEIIRRGKDSTGRFISRELTPINDASLSVTREERSKMCWVLGSCGKLHGICGPAERSPRRESSNGCPYLKKKFRGMQKREEGWRDEGKKEQCTDGEDHNSVRRAATKTVTGSWGTRHLGNHVWVPHNTISSSNDVLIQGKREFSVEARRAMRHTAHRYGRRGCPNDLKKKRVTAWIVGGKR